MQEHWILGGFNFDVAWAAVYAILALSRVSCVAGLILLPKALNPQP